MRDLGIDPGAEGSGASFVSILYGTSHVIFYMHAVVVIGMAGSGKTTLVNVCYL